MDAVRSHHKVVVAGRGVAESDPDPVNILGQRRERDTQSMWDRSGTGQQRLLQSDTGNGQPGPHIAPELFEIGLAEQLPLLIKESPATDHCGGPIGSLPDAERPQDPHAIRGQIDPCPDCRPRCAPFNELWG